MSKHHHHHDECCYPMTGYGMSGYGMGGYGGGQVGSYGGGSTSWGIRWIYALLILIVIVLQFGRKDCRFPLRSTNACEGDGVGTAAGYGGFLDGCFNNEAIDRSVLFIIVVFLLVLCAGCWWGGQGGYGGYGGGYGGGCGGFY